MIYASKQAKNLAINFARELQMTVEEFFARAPEFEERGIGPKGKKGWRARDVRALHEAIASQPVHILGPDERGSSHPSVTAESRFTSAGLEAAKELAAEGGYDLNYIADYCVAGGAIDGSITRFDVDSAVAPRGSNLWERFTGWMTDLGRKFASREGLTLVTSLFSMVASAAAVVFANGNSQGALVAVIVATASGIVALYLGAPLAGIDLGAYASRIIRWRPKWQRPAWLKRPQVELHRPSWLRKPNISRPQVQLSWPSRVPRPSRQWLRPVAITALVVVIAVAYIGLTRTSPGSEPAPTEPVAVVEEAPVTVVAATTVEPTAEPTAEPTTEPTTAPAQVAEEVTVVGRVKEAGDKPVSGAEIYIGESSDRTDDEGIFRVPDVPKAKDYTLDIVAEDTLRRIVREGGSFLSGPTTDDVGEFLLSDAEVVEVEAETAAETAAQTETEAEEAETTHTVTVEAGDTVWNLLEEELGHAPTWEQIKSVVDANDLVDKGVNDAGVWIVLIYTGQTIDLGPALGG